MRKSQNRNGSDPVQAPASPVQQSPGAGQTNRSRTTAILMNVEREETDADGKVTGRRLYQMQPVFEANIPEEVLRWIETLKVMDPPSPEGRSS